jgi:hypothetical protein
METDRVRQHGISYIHWALLFVFAMPKSFMNEYALSSRIR